MTAVAAANGADRVGNLPALTDGYSAAFAGAAIIAAVGAVVVAVALRLPKPQPAQDAPSPSDTEALVA